MKLLFIFVAVNVALTGAESSCADGWIDMGGESCLKFGPQIKMAAWSDVQYDCDSIGAFLPELTSSEQIDLFQDLMKSFGDLYGTSNVFLGGSDLTHENSWRWLAHGTEIENINWAPGSPDDSPFNNKDCLSGMSNSSLWMDINCEQEFERVAFVCMTLQDLPTTASTLSTSTPLYSSPPATTTATTTPTSPPPSCSSGWQEFEGACYIYKAERRTWEEVSAACQHLHPGAELTSVTNSRENEFLRNLINGSSPWTGGHRQPETPSGSWTWSDGAPWSYTNWASGNPDNYPDWHCVGMSYSDGLLYNHPCTSTYRSLCKYRLGE